MASIKNLKRDLNYIFSDIIEECYIWMIDNEEKKDKAENIIDNAITSFDTLIEKVNNKPVEGAKKHFHAIVKELELNVADLRNEIDTLFDIE